MEKSRPFYLQQIVNPLTNVWYKNTPIGINSISSMIKDFISNSPLQNSENHLVNHSTRKALVKKLKQQQVPKSEIISITGYTSEAGLDAYDSGDEVKQKKTSHFTGNHQPVSRLHPKTNILSLQITQQFKVHRFPPFQMTISFIKTSTSILSALIIVQSIFI